MPRDERCGSGKNLETADSALLYELESDVLPRKIVYGD